MYAEHILKKCLKLLNSLINQRDNGKNESIPFRLRLFLKNHEELKDFLSYPSRILYINILADLVSIVFRSKICVYSIVKNSELIPKLYCANFANNNKKKIKILRIRNSFFVPLRKIISIISDGACQETQGPSIKDTSIANSIYEMIDDENDLKSNLEQLSPMQENLENSLLDEEKSLENTSLQEFEALFGEGKEKSCNNSLLQDTQDEISSISDYSNGRKSRKNSLNILDPINLEQSFHLLS